MRSEEEILSLILNLAKADERIRAVFLNGSRSDPSAKRDIFQDYDITYIVTSVEPFVSDQAWIDTFGKRLILQMPQAMVLNNEDSDNADAGSFTWLMLFEDGNRIDLTLFALEKLMNGYEISDLGLLLSDKDCLFPDLPAPSGKKYRIKKPSEKEFLDCCNEFWWVSTYVAKGLWRDELTYAKDMLEMPVRKMFMKMAEWNVGVKYDFSVSFGKSGKRLKDLAPGLLRDVLDTYPDAAPDNIWKGLFVMGSIFRGLAVETAAMLGYKYDFTEDTNVTAYLEKVKAMTVPATPADKMP